MPAPPFHCPVRCAGFSLVEQVVTLALAAMLIAAAVPSMARMAGRSATEVAVAQLMDAARMARSSAILHNTHVLLCPSRDHHHCERTTQWQAGWIVAYDRDHDSQPDAAPLLVAAADPARVRIVGSAGRRLIRFQANGSAAGTNMSLTVCPRHANPTAARMLVVSNAGRLRLDRADRAHQARCATSP